MTEIRHRIRTRCNDCGSICYFDADNQPEDPVCPDCMEMYQAEFVEYITRHQDLDEEEGE